MRDRARAYLTDNPEATGESLAAYLGTTPGSARQIAHRIGFSLRTHEFKTPAETTAKTAPPAPPDAQSPDAAKTHGSTPAATGAPAETPAKTEPAATQEEAPKPKMGVKDPESNPQIQVDVSDVVRAQVKEAREFAASVSAKFDTLKGSLPEGSELLTQVSAIQTELTALRARTEAPEEQTRARLKAVDLAAAETIGRVADYSQATNRAIVIYGEKVWKFWMEQGYTKEFPDPVDFADTLIGFFADNKDELTNLYAERDTLRAEVERLRIEVDPIRRRERIRERIMELYIQTVTLNQPANPEALGTLAAKFLSAEFPP